MNASLRVRLAAALRSPLTPIAAVIFLLPFGRSSEAGVALCILGAVIFLVRSPHALDGHPGARLLLFLWACYFAAAIVSALDAVNPARSWSTVAAFLRYAPFGVYMCFAVRRESRVHALYLVAGVLTGLWALDAWVQVLTGFSLGGPAEAERVSGIFGAGNLKLGPVLASLAPFALWSVRGRCGRTGLVVAFLFLLVPVLLAGSRAAWLTYALVALAFAWCEARSPLRFATWIAAACMIGVLVVGLAWRESPRFDARAERTMLAFDGSEAGLDAALAGRLRIWETSVRMIGGHPVNGVGVRGFRYAYPEYASPDDAFVDPHDDEGASHAHQVVLEILTETGVVGLILWLCGAVLAWRAWRAATTAARARAYPATIALVVTLFPLNTHLAFYSAWWGLLFWWLLALWCASLYADFPERHTTVPAEAPHAT